MATPTYDLLDSTTLSSSASSVTFSGISGDYRDLVLVSQLGSAGGLSGIKMRLNSDTGTNYNRVFMQGDGSSASSGSSISATRFDLQGTTFTDTGLTQIFIAQIMDYTATDKHKSLLVRYDTPTGSGAGTTATAGRYASTSAITAVEIFNTDYNFTIGSTFYLFGIAS